MQFRSQLTLILALLFECSAALSSGTSPNVTVSDESICVKMIDGRALEESSDIQRELKAQLQKLDFRSNLATLTITPEIAATPWGEALALLAMNVGAKIYWENPRIRKEFLSTEKKSEANYSRFM